MRWDLETSLKYMRRFVRLTPTHGEKRMGFIREVETKYTTNEVSRITFDELQQGEKLYREDIAGYRIAKIELATITEYDVEVER